MAPELTHRERVLLALDHKDTDRVPISLVGSAINPPAYERLDSFLRSSRGIDAGHYLAQAIDLHPVVSRYVGPKLSDGTDFWGVHRSAVAFGEGFYDEIDIYPLGHAATIDDLETHPWPTTKWFDYSVLPNQINQHRRNGDYATWLYGCYSPFECCWYMLGFERIFAAMVDSPDFVHELLTRVTDFMAADLRCALEAVGDQLDLVYTADDIAGQSGLLMSLGTWSEFVGPCHKRLNDIVHEFGCRSIYHSDGAVTKAVPSLIDAGVDVLEALQFDAAGMDPDDLKTRFGDRLCFAGGVSVQKTMPFGSPQDVRDEVLRLKATLGREGGYLLGPSHAIQADTSAENILALFDTAMEPNG